MDFNVYLKRSFKNKYEKKIKLPRDDVLKAEQYMTENTVGANKGLIRGS